MEADEDEEPTTPMLMLPDDPRAPERYAGAARCRCLRYHPFELVAPIDSPSAESSAFLGCLCGYVLIVRYRWKTQVLSVDFAERGTLRN